MKTTANMRHLDFASKGLLILIGLADAFTVQAHIQERQRVVVPLNK